MFLAVGKAREVKALLSLIRIPGIPVRNLARRELSSTLVKSGSLNASVDEMSKARDSLAEVSTAGAFVRTPSVFQNSLSAEQCVRGRLVLYVSFACPWASRCLAVIALKGLENVIQVVPVLPTWNQTKPGIAGDDHRGWVFRARAASEVEAGPSFEHVPLVDPIFGAQTVRGVYEAAEPDALIQKFTVPLLVDKASKRIVCNESSVIIRDLNFKFNAPGLAAQPQLDLYPAHLAQAIDAVNERMYERINNGVYKCGFATSQAAYEDAARALAAGLDEMEAILSKKRYLVGDQLTEADIRLFVTLVRYDPVYIVHFKTSFRTLRGDYPALLSFCQDIHQTRVGQGNTVGSTVYLDHIKRHYYCSHTKLNPYAIVPVGHPQEGVEWEQRVERPA